MPLTEHILRQIEDLGFAVRETTQGESRIIIAEPKARRVRQVVRIDGTDEESRYRAVCQLAVQCGIDLFD